MTEDDNKVVTMKVRVTPEFREKLATTAKENNRSMNAEIVDRLEKSFESTIFTNEQKIEYGKGFLSGTAEAFIILYTGILDGLKNSYINDPNPELFLEIEKYKFLIEKLKIIADNKDSTPLIHEINKLL